MPWTEPPANSDELRRCIRDLVALSTFPAAWRNYDERQIGDSIVAALITMLAADFVLIILPGQGNQLAELIRSEPDLNPASLDHVRTVLKQEKAAFSFEQEFVVANASGGNVHVATSPIGLGGDAVLAAGSSRGTFPTKTERLLLTTGANQAAIALQQWLGDADKRRFTAAEGELRLLNENLERRVEQRTIELEVAHRKLLADNLEREQADRRIQKLRDELFHMARLTAAGEMAAALTHELTQPLTAVINSVNAAKRLLAREDSASLAIVQDIADEAASQALRASEIIRGFRQFVSLDETERRIEALPSMIEEAGALALSSAAPLAARLTFDFDDQAADVFVNRVQIQQVLVNLIRNAFEAMVDQEWREITLATRVLGDGMVEVAVSDIGPGIHDDIAGRLFEPFVSNKHNGMGLGLAISRSIVEAHGGKLTAEQKPGGGSIFRFTLPSGGAADAS